MQEQNVLDRSGISWYPHWFIEYLLIDMLPRLIIYPRRRRTPGHATVMAKKISINYDDELLDIVDPVTGKPMPLQWVSLPPEGGALRLGQALPCGIGYGGPRGGVPLGKTDIVRLQRVADFLEELEGTSPPARCLKYPHFPTEYYHLSFREDRVDCGAGVGYVTSVFLETLDSGFKLQTLAVTISHFIRFPAPGLLRRSTAFLSRTRGVRPWQ